MARKKTTKKASFEVELLDCEKDVAHKRLGRYDTPNLSSYARAYMQETGELFQLEGFVFFYGSVNEIADVEETFGLDVALAWATKNYPPCYNGDKPYLSVSSIVNWVRLPSGTWFAKSKLGWITADMDKGGWEHEPTIRARGSVRTQWNWGNTKTINAFPEWNEKQKRFEQISDEFSAAWLTARQAYRKALKSSGKTEAREAREAQENHAQRTQARMNVLMQANKLRDELEAYIKSVEADTMTVKSVGEIYAELTRLETLNKKMKKVYGSQMPKE